MTRRSASESRQRRSEKGIQKTKNKRRDYHYHLLFSVALVQTQRHILLILRQRTMQQQGLKNTKGTTRDTSLYFGAVQACRWSDACSVGVCTRYSEHRIQTAQKCCITNVTVSHQITPTPAQVMPPTRRIHNTHTELKASVWKSTKRRS